MSDDEQRKALMKAIIRNLAQNTHIPWLPGTSILDVMETRELMELSGIKTEEELFNMWDYSCTVADEIIRNIK